jgi:peptidoglycan/LPS O-acetylase OafA/YrhL
MLGQLRRIHWIIGGWLLLAISYGLATKLDRHFSYTLREVLILRHIPFFAIGILFYRMRTYPAQWRLDAAMIGACIAAIAISYPIVYAEVALACTAIFALFALDRLTWLRAAPFAFFGTISYSLYLLHQAIGFSLIWHLEANGLSAGSAGLCAALIVTVLATLLTFLVERPALRMIRDAWKKRRALVPTRPAPRT